MVVLKRPDAGRAGFVVAADSVDEFARKVLPLAGAVHDATWKAYPLPEGTDPAKASRMTL
jgi:hypothetical protein